MAERFLDTEEATGSIPVLPTIMINYIYEDKDLLVVNKPAGIAVHPDKTHKSGTLIQEILKTHLEIKDIGDEPEIRPGLVHRLDKDTSGVLIIAKNQPAFDYLKNQFQERKIKKTYIALVEGNLKEKKGVINLPIGRSKKSPTLRLASPKARGFSPRRKGLLPATAIFQGGRENPQDSRLYASSFR